MHKCFRQVRAMSFNLVHLLAEFAGTDEFMKIRFRPCPSRITLLRASRAYLHFD